MAITLIPVEECFSVVETNIVPNFHFLNTESPDFRFMRMQPKGYLRANPETGVHAEDPLHIHKCRQALQIARSEHVDLFLTPEYCIPLMLVNEMIANRDLQPPPHKLWCLCCEGVAWTEFNDHIHRWSDDAHLARKPLENLTSSNFVGFILYVFQSQEGDRLCIVPQCKFQPMREELEACERGGLSRGHYVVLFGERLQNRLAAVICADAFHPEIHSSQIFFPGGEEQKYIILHPQLNSAPRHAEIANLRHNLFRGECGRDTVYITANWAADTSIQFHHPQVQELVIKSPWSGIYRRFINYSNEGYIEKLREVRQHNMRYGLGFGFYRQQQYKVWYAHKTEHLQICLLRKPFGGGPEIVRPQGAVMASKSFIPNETNDGWLSSELMFENSLPEILVKEATGDYEYPVRANVDERDRFFSYCLGHSEEMEMTLDDHELGYRVSYHIDDACESYRERQVMKIANLIRCLKRLGDRHYPSQIRRVEGGFELGLLPKAPINVVSKKPHGKEGALVIYVESESEVKQKAEQMIREYGEFVIGDKVCVLTRGAMGEIIHYPVHNDDVTAPSRVEQTTDYTQGGLSIEQSLN